MESPAAVSGTLPTADDHPSLTARFRSLDFCLALLLAASALSLYLSFPTRMYVLEGLARAIPMELGLYRRLLLGNYLLYGLVGNLFYHALLLLGFTSHAFIALQAMDGLIGAAGLGVFFFIARVTGLDRRAAFLWTSALGLSLGYWLWSTEAENYILSTFVLQVNFLCLLVYHKTRRIPPWALGLLQALVVFGHLVNGLFMIVALWIFIATDANRWKIAFLEYAAACMTALFLGFGTALIFVKPTGWRDAVGWLLGSAAGTGGGVRWHGSWWSGTSFLSWVRMTIHIFAPWSAAIYTHPAGVAFAWIFTKAALILLAIIVVCGLWRLKKVQSSERVILVACGIWLASYAVIFTSWEPTTMVYRVSDLIPLFLSLAILTSINIEKKSSLWIPAALMVCLGIGNFGTEVYPRSFWQNNSRWVLTQFVKQQTDGSSWILGTNGPDNIYLAYFAERRPVILDNFHNQPDRLKAFLKNLWKAHQKIYVLSPILSDPYWGHVMTAFRLVPRAQDPAGLMLYQVEPLK